VEGAEVAIALTAPSVRVLLAMASEGQKAQCQSAPLIPKMVPLKNYSYVAHCSTNTNFLEAVGTRTLNTKEQYGKCAPRTHFPSLLQGKYLTLDIVIVTHLLPLPIFSGPHLPQR
jgi:hypothetical protein